MRPPPLLVWRKKETEQRNVGGIVRGEKAHVVVPKQEGYIFWVTVAGWRARRASVLFKAHQRFLLSTTNYPDGT